MNPALPEKLISHWDFEDSSTSTTAIDSEGVHDGSISGGPPFITSPEGSALEFDGTDDMVDVGDHAEYKFGTSQNFSIVARYRAPTTQTGDYSKFIMIDTWNWNNGGWHMRASYDGGIGFAIEDAGGTRLGVSNESAHPVPAGEWYHVAVSVNRTGMTHLYVDGVKVGSSDFSSLGDVSQYQNPLTFAYGSQNGYYTNGDLASARIYKQSLSQTEVKALYNQGG